MDFKEIKGKKHYIYDNEGEFRLHFPSYGTISSWRSSEEGDWAFSDDGCICQILKKAVMVDNGKNTDYIRTICGTFRLTSKKKMIGEIAENIYTFSGTNNYQRFYKKSNYTTRELLFARYIANGEDVVKSYLRAYPTNNEVTAKRSAGELLKTKRIQNMVDVEIQKILEEEGITPGYLLKRMKDIADLAERDSDKLRSLETLSKIAGLFNNEKKQEQLTVWAGFSPEQIESIKGKEPKLIGHAKRRED